MHVTDKNKLWLSVQGWKKIFQANGSSKQAELIIFISGKLYFKPKLIGRDKDGYSILTKRTIYQEEIIIVNLYGSNVSAPNFIKQITLGLKVQISTNTMIMGDFNILLSPVGLLHLDL
jgi:hypothetical protein